MKAKWDQILAGVEKPARYTDNEHNAVHKDWQTVDVTMALAFPDVYEVGMGHLGFKILYEIINQRPDAVAERVFAPWPDMDDRLRAEGLPLGSLESGRSLREFDLVGFTLQYEMSYTNILHMLDRAGIPRRARDRQSGDPLVIAGGPGAYNVEPLAPFFDAVLLGEGEEAIADIIEAVKAQKRQQASRADQWEALGVIDGIYIPAWYRDHYDSAGHFAGLERLHRRAPEFVTKRIAADLEAVPAPVRFVVPYIEVVHDRAMVEIMRGCTRGCRFCQAGMLYRPARERKKDTIKDQLAAILAHTGYDEVSLTSLSSGDYGCIGPLVEELTAAYEGTGTAVSLPSLRVDSFSVHLAEQIQKFRKTGLTFAPEAGTQRLRDVINKNVCEKDLLEAAAGAFAAGWHQLKLYFMIGLPTETMDDVDGIAELAHSVLRLGKTHYQKGRKRPTVAVSVSSFVPKPATPFQWEPQNTKAVLQEKQQHLRRRLKHPGIQFQYHDVETSVLEAAFARGDRRLASVLETAADLGCRFDAWSEFFRADLWQEAFCQNRIEPEYYALKNFSADSALPWEHLHSGVAKSYLWQEYQAALAGSTTHDCRWGACTGCAVCTVLNVQNILQGESARA